MTYLDWRWEPMEKVLNRYAWITIPTLDFGDVRITRRHHKDGREDWHHHYRLSEITPASKKRLSRLLEHSRWDAIAEPDHYLFFVCIHFHWQPEVK